MADEKEASADGVNRDEVEEFVRKTLEFDRLVRAYAINQAIDIEWWVERIIATHFCRREEEYALFCSLLFQDGQIPFSRKIIILKKLLRLCYPEIYNNKTNLIKRLDDFREVRNRFAHSAVVIPEDDARKSSETVKLKLRYYKDGQELFEEVTQEKADEYGESGQRLFTDLIVLQILVSQRASGLSMEEWVEKHKVVAPEDANDK